MLIVHNNVFKFGAFSFLISGVLYAAYFLCSFPVPLAPTESNALLLWVREWRNVFSIADELLMFATVFLLPAMFVFARTFKSHRSSLVLAGCSMMQLLVAPAFLLVVLLLGRLAYPVYNYRLSADVITFIVSTLIGTLHAVSILLAGSLLLLSLSLRKVVPGPLPVVMGIAVFCCQVASAYPWLISAHVQLLCQLTFPAWLLVTGIVLFRKKAELLPA